MSFLDALSPGRTVCFKSGNCLKSRKLHLYFRKQQIEGGGGRERVAVVESVESAVDAPPKRTPTVTTVELRESLLTDN